MDPFRTDGAIGWPELLTTDPEAAAVFYAAVFGWTTQTMPMDSGPYYVANVAERPQAGIMLRPEEAIPPVWMFYVTVHDLEAATARVAARGGTVEVPIMDIPNVGRFAGVVDPQGAMLMLMEYGAPADPVDEMPPVDFLDAFATEGAFSWFQLLTPDPGASARWYAEVFGWTVEEQAQPMGAYFVVKIGDVGFGGITAPFSDRMPPHWQGYVTVDDADATAARVAKEGGSVMMPPTDVPGVGRMLAFRDPQGAMLMAVAYAIPGT